MRLRQLQDALKEKELDGCILDARDPHFRYFLQKDVRHGTLFIPADGMPTVFIHHLEELDHEFGVVKLRDDELGEYLDDYETAGYNPDSTTVTRHDNWTNHLALRDISRELHELRKIKTGQEIEELREAAEIADDIMQSVLDGFTYDTEGAIKRDILTNIAQRGLEPSFDPVVAFGESAAIPHYTGDKPLGEGFILIDVGVRYNGYCSDITRTVHIGGEPSDKETEIYERVRAVQQRCLDKAQPGMSCSDLYQIADDALGDSFTHGLGHGVGVEIHEAPRIKAESDETLQEGMVVTIEPGWYEEFGVRLEDMILITDDGNERLTTTRHGLIL